MDQNFHILIVDDEESIRETFREFLIREGYTVTIAEDAETALEQLEAEKIDIVITDILLPKISGVELLKIIHEKYQEIQVLMITGEPNLESASQSLRYGACDYLVKPVNKTAIIKAVGNTVKIKKLEDSNRVYRDNLENLVRARTKELEEALVEKERLQDQIIQYEKYLVIEDILSGISHDINNSLSPISLYAEAVLMKEKNINESSKRYIKKIIEAAEEIETTILKIDNYNVTKRMDLPVLKIDIADLISDTISIFKNRKNINPGLQIIYTPSENLPQIIGYKNKITTIFTEILTNAYEAMPGGGLIKIRSMVKKGKLIVMIRDEGPGMTEEEISKCIDPFCTSKGPKHSGLGLSTVFGMMNSMGGTVEFESTPGSGTEVVLSFKTSDSDEVLT